MKSGTIIMGIIVIVALAGALWYFSPESDNQTASITGIKEGSSETDGDFILGDPDAPVTMVEYSSHFCGHCVDFHRDTLPIIIEKYVKTGKVKIISKIISSLELNTAVLCAGEQDKYWEYNEYLFEHTDEIQSIGDLKSIVGELSLDKDNFDACYSSGKYEDRIIDGFEKAGEAGVEGTPTFFINDQKVVGNQPIEVFENIIEGLLNQ